MRTFTVMCIVSLVGTSTVLVASSQQRLFDSPTGDLRRVIGAIAGSESNRRDDPPSLVLQTALDEALINNPRIIVLRREYEAMQYRPAQALGLAPPNFEAQIWQWPFKTLDPRNTNMYMFTVGQALPGRGKRALRVAVADKDAELASAVIASRRVTSSTK